MMRSSTASMLAPFELVAGLLLLFSPPGLGRTGPADRSAGVAAFETEVYPILRKSCLPCHARREPTIVSGDLEQAYQASKKLVNFTAVESSPLVLRFKDGHCGKPCRSDTAALEAAIKRWGASEKGERP